MAFASSSSIIVGGGSSQGSLSTSIVSALVLLPYACALFRLHGGSIPSGISGACVF